MRAEPDVVSPNVLEAEELVGHEFADEQERSLAVREIVALGAREAIMTLPDGCFAQVLIDGQPALLRARIEPREPVAKRGSGDAFLAGYVAARYDGSAARGVPALRRRLRRGVHRAPRRRPDRPPRGAPLGARGGAGAGGAAGGGEGLMTESNR